MAPIRRRRLAACTSVLLGASIVVAACTGGDGRRGAGPVGTVSTPRSTTSADAPAAGRSGEGGSALPPGADATVVSVTDGDTIVVRIGATTERVRLIGIDTPETRDPRRPVECFGREASARTGALLPPGTAVRIELDVERRDRYERLLAYVWRVEDATFVNAALVEGGWAVPYRFPPNVRYADLFSRLGADARVAARGLWSACGGADTPAAP